MIEDDVIREVRATREEYARLHGFSIRAMVADLQARDVAGTWTVVSLPARRVQDETNEAIVDERLGSNPASKALLAEATASEETACAVPIGERETMAMKRSCSG